MFFTDNEGWGLGLTESLTAGRMIIAPVQGGMQDQMRFEDENGDLHKVTMMGLECRIFQHEYDHMEGTNFTKRVSKLKLNMGKKRAAKQKKKSMIPTT